MQHSKRASIYVSDASIILAQRTPIISPTSPHDSLMSPSSETPDFIDHYAILELETHASAEDITSAFRRLRLVYFQSDATKYKALTTAFDVLRDPDARQAYDLNYRARAAAPSLSSIGEVMEQSKHERKDSAMGDDAGMAAVPEEEEMEITRSEDPNWALKRCQRLSEPLIGTRPYQSFVPVLEVYAQRCRHPTLKCSRPTYIGQVARNARPS
ncbi:Nn.00g094770.m01.CDS01 [Neocucurbitaria sp. VM-36]